MCLSVCLWGFVCLLVCLLVRMSAAAGVCVCLCVCGVCVCGCVCVCVCVCVLISTGIGLNELRFIALVCHTCIQALSEAGLVLIDFLLL